MTDNDKEGDYGASSSAAEREAIVARRRARLSAKAKGDKKRRIFQAVTLLVAGLVIFIVLNGPDRALKFFILKDASAVTTSEVDMVVETPKSRSNNLDFLVPAAPEKQEEKAAPINDMDKRVAAMRAELDALARKGPDNEVLAAKLEEVAKRLAERMDQKFEGEFRKMADERRRLDEKARTEAEQNKEEAALDQQQRESGTVIIDESLSRFAAYGSTPSMPPPAPGGNRAFLATAAGSTVETVAAQALPDPARTVVQGTIISAVLETAIETSLPGSIRAQVIEPVYSFDGSQVLMPAGTMLVGTFNDDIEIEQGRVLISWNRAVTPEGKSIAIGSTGADLLGRAGTAGNVDNRYGAKFGAGLLVSAISAVPSLLGSLAGGGAPPSSGTTINIGGGGGGQGIAGQLGTGMGTQVAEQGKGVLEQYLSLPPVIRIPQGEEIRVFVNRDLYI